MSAVFGLNELKNGYLPIFSNKEENQYYVAPYPAAEFYNPDTMSKYCQLQSLLHLVGATKRHDL
jgi:hypothetical protein